VSQELARPVRGDADHREAGWYPDPGERRRRLRYWDGTSWTAWVSEQGCERQLPLPSSWDANSWAQRRSTPVRMLTWSLWQTLAGFVVSVLAFLSETGGLVDSIGRVVFPLLLLAGLAQMVGALAWWGASDARAHRYVGAIFKVVLAIVMVMPTAWLLWFLLREFGVR
jgi:hypothetical protein